MITIESWLKDLVNPTEEELAVMAEITEKSFVEANEILIRQGQVSGRIGLLVQGATRTYFEDAAGNEKTLGFAFEGQPLLVVDSFIHQLPSAVSSVTLEPCVIIWTDFQRFNAFVHQFPRYQSVLISAIARWFTENKGRMEYQHRSSAKEKYDLMCQWHPQIIKRVPLKFVASYLGIAPETLSRIRASK
jgi:CRP-like cAMP-binding protein